ncbi:MAG: hypothetical protein H7320_25210 [Ferruginibacter sp.]|nr:hypothetical protein [Ferruginibacter sp.]
MKKSKFIQLKAAVLLMVFGLNTVVGFACNIGIDLGFNSIHHGDEKPTKIHVHADGQKHDHHSQSVGLQHKEMKKDNSEKKGCCNNEVQKLQSLDKALNQNAKITIDAPVFVAILGTFFGIDIFNSAKAYPLKYVARFYYPPPTDIRIAIQSFQI